ncbi:MAG: replicative DNA helicase [Thermaurantiacus sp.]
MSTQPARLSSIETSTSPRLPYNIEAERALLGALMIEVRLVEDVAGFLDATHFHEPLHGRIYAAIRAKADANQVPTPTTLRPLFESDPAMAELGGPAYLLDLTTDAGALLIARDCARQVHELALLRALVRVGTDLVAAAGDTSEDVPPMERIAAAEEALYRVAETGDASPATQTFRSAAGKALEMAARARRSGGHLSGLTTGLTGLNQKLGGLQNSDLVILAGRPGMGKTALATNIAFACAWRHRLEREEDGIATGAPVAFFSLEMSADQLATRILAQRAQVSSEALRTGRINQAQFNAIARAADELSDLPFYIDDSPALTIAALRSRARRLKRQRGIGLVVVDYLQLLRGTARNASENRVNELSEITRGLKTLAKELDVPVLALSQLSRQVEGRDDKRPQLSDLRESGTIEQDADIVLFVFREEYYHQMKKPADESSAEFQAWQEKDYRLRGLADITVAKQRHGAAGRVNLYFAGEYTQFTDRAEGDAPDSD